MSLLYSCAELDLAGHVPSFIAHALDISPQMVAWLMGNDGYQLVKEKVNANKQQDQVARHKAECNTGER